MAAADQAEQIYQRDRDRLVRLAYLLTGSHAVAEELVQDAFVSTWSRLPGVEAPRAYVRQAVVNLARRHHRRAALELERAPTPPGPQLDPEIDETWNALWRLGDRQRIALVLRFYEDLDVAGVAAAMDCRLGTAKSLIHRGLVALRGILEDQ